jgi:glycosyltransferase involved in cell wall biosynthesis
LKYVDHITVPSAWEASFYSRKLGLPQSKFSVCHLGAYDRRSATSSERAPEVEPPETRYLFSGGRTDRDYATLLSAVAGTGIKTHVNTRPYIVRGLNIPNEVSLNDLMSGEEYVDAVTHASIVVVPLKAVDHAAGLSLILDAMMFGRPVICSDVPAAREYVIDSTTGILVPPGDVDALRKTIRSLASDPALCDHLGRAARTLYEERFTFAAFAQRSCEIIARATGVSSRLQPHQEPGP